MMQRGSPAPQGQSMIDSAFAKIARQLYRARPFTKAIPFNKTLTGTPDEFVTLWVPVNAYFEVVHINIRATVASVDLSICDTNPAAPFAFVMPSTTEYSAIDLTPGYRSQNFSNVAVIISNPGNVACQIKGVIYGYEVTREGSYR